jgi:hypothetical protein
MLVANKTDGREEGTGNRCVTTEEGQRLARVSIRLYVCRNTYNSFKTHTNPVYFKKITSEQINNKRNNKPM